MSKTGIFSLLVLLLVFSSCGSDPKYDASTAQGAYETALRLDEDERYEEALALYRTVKNKHPYSKYATESELKVADIHFKREAFVEAQHAYQTFKEFHPKYRRIAYVTHRLAMSYFNQLPSTVDRDLNQAYKALLYFDEVITSFPESEFVGESIKHKKKTLELLAGKIYYIAEFYFIREHWLSARQRFESLLKKFPNHGFDSRALYGAAISASKLGDKQLADKYYEILKTRHADSSEYRNAKRELGYE